MGVCGTDREAFSKKSFVPPEGKDEIVIGHEVLAQAVEAGPEVKGVSAGDYVTFTIRRGCGRCLPCASGRADMCATGDYKERGLDYIDGFNSELVIDKGENCVRVPDEIKELGVLCEPLSAIEKALSETEKAQARLPGADFRDKKCLIIGLGPIGLLASMGLALRGARVYGLDAVDDDSARPMWLKGIGGTYMDSRRVEPENIARETGGLFDFIFQAAGLPKLTLGLLPALGPNGALILFSSGEGEFTINGGELIRSIIDNNQLIIGSISSSRTHFELAIDDLKAARTRWGGPVDKLITTRYRPEDFEKPFTQHPPDEIKAVIDWGSGT